MRSRANQQSVGGRREGEKKNSQGGGKWDMRNGEYYTTYFAIEKAQGGEPTKMGRKPRLREGY